MEGRKARNLLKNFYGLQASEQSKKRSDPLDIDSTAFHAEVFLNTALHEQNLSELIHRDNDLVSEIKKLDGEMKTLVCENYNKFISATDSIRKMRSNMENMESEMDKLSKSMDSITVASNKINDSLAERRGRIHHLGGVHTVLKKLSFVFELPAQLKQCLHKQMYTQAVQYHSQAAPLLMHYRHLAVFKKIEDECTVVMDQVGRKIREKMHRDSSTTTDIVESFGLLVGLATQQPQGLAKEYLQIFQTRFQTLKAVALEHISTMSPPSSSNSAIDLAVAKVAYLNSSLLKEFALLVKSFEEYFLMQQKVSSPSDKEASPKTPIFFAKMSPDERELIRMEYKDRFEAATSDYFHIVEGFLPTLDPTCPTTSLAVFDKLYTDVASMDSLKRTARMTERIQELTVGWLGKTIANVFARVKHGFFDKIIVANSAEANLRTSVEDVESWVQTILNHDCLSVLQGFIAPNSCFVKTSQQGFNDCTLQVRKGLEELWYNIRHQMMDLTSTTAQQGMAPKASPVISLMLARIAKDFSTKIVDNVYRNYADRLFMQADLHTASSQSQKLPRLLDRRDLVIVADSNANKGLDDQAETFEGMMSKSRELSGVWKETAQKLLSRYVELIGMDHNLVIRRYFEGHEWLESAEPAKPSTIWDRILTEFDTCNREVLQLYDNEGVLERKEGYLGGHGGRKAPHRPGHSRNTSLAGGNYPYMNASASNSSFKTTGVQRPQNTIPSPTHQNTLDHLMSGIDKLFSERVEYFGLVEDSHSGIMMGIIKVLAKSFIEEVRNVTLNKSGFRQIQLDVEYVRMRLWQYAQDSRLLCTLLDEVMSSAYRRALNTQGFEREALDRILSSHDSLVSGPMNK